MSAETSTERYTDHGEAPDHARDELGAAHRLIKASREGTDFGFRPGDSPLLRFRVMGLVTDADSRDEHETVPVDEVEIQLRKAEDPLVVEQLLSLLFDMEEYDAIARLFHTDHRLFVIGERAKFCPFVLKHLETFSSYDDVLSALCLFDGEGLTPLIDLLRSRKDYYLLYHLRVCNDVQQAFRHQAAAILDDNVDTIENVSILEAIARYGRNMEARKAAITRIPIKAGRPSIARNSLESLLVDEGPPAYFSDELKDHVRAHLADLPEEDEA